MFFLLWQVILSAQMSMLPSHFFFVSVTKRSSFCGKERCVMMTPKDMLRMTAYCLLHDVISLFPDLRLPSRDLMNFFPVLGGAYLLLSVLTVCQIESKR